MKFVLKNINLLNYLNPKNICRIIKIKLSDVFEIVAFPSFKGNQLDKGKYEIVSATKFNNGVSKYTNDKNENKLIPKGIFTTANVGAGSGYIFYHDKPFYNGGNIICMNPKIKINLLNTFIFTNFINSFTDGCYASLQSKLKDIIFYIIN